MASDTPNGRFLAQDTKIKDTTITRQLAMR